MKRYILCFCVILLTGCMKSYNKPEYEEVGTSETAFVVPLEAATSDQVKLNSEEAYKALMVTTKRIQIPKRWNQTGRWYTSGEWISMVRVIKVDRSPVTREWTAEGTSGTANRDQAIWVESSDSVGFSVGFNCTAYISESDAAKFLYWYPSGSLATVMDQELRNRIQQTAATVAAKYPLDNLREKKNEIVDEVRNDVILFFEKRGITVTTIGMFGGFAYENKDIQGSIDNVFIAQQKKNEEKALLDAMASKEKRLEREGVAEANQVREVAKGRKDAAIIEAEGAAQGITLVNEASEAAAKNPLFLQLKMLEVEIARIQKWNGDVPKLTMGDSGNFVPMIQVPEVK